MARTSSTTTHSMTNHKLIMAHTSQLGAAIVGANCRMIPPPTAHASCTRSNTRKSSSDSSYKNTVTK